MMRKRLMSIVSMLVFLMLFACQAAEEPKTQTVKEPAMQTPQESAAKAVQDSSVRKMSITGEIAQGMNSYIIRGQMPPEVFTILNPDPTILDEFVKSEKVVKIDVRIVSGDNVAIEMLDGKEYNKEIQ
jgi:hypothetical protein